MKSNKAMAQRKYTEEDRAVALAAYTAHDGNLDRTSKFCKIPRNTIRGWVNGEAVNPATVEKATSKKAELADLFETEVREALGLAAGKRDEASYSQLMTAAAIGVDKMQLLRSKPTVITEDVSALPDAELDRRIAELESAERERVAALERGEVPTADSAENSADARA